MFYSIYIRKEFAIGISRWKMFSSITRVSSNFAILAAAPDQYKNIYKGDYEGRCLK